MRYLLALTLCAFLFGCEDASQWGMSLHEKLTLRQDPVTAEQREDECDWIKQEIELARSTLRFASAQNSAVTDPEIKRLMREDAEQDIRTLKARQERFGC